ncbi:hypothetical protein [Lactococcus lactis]|uniref:hypothetical protein n=1 Tax=Lactococcus lactis TaxID=1358 RepID=UPI0028FD677C|nr:hypothetical protein [Lactococcus lactis]MDU0398601.1 hypothetical protein [Lactococcus lactis]
MKENLSLVSSISTGAAGVDFERRIQAFFIIQMINGGYAPALPASTITKVICQGRNHGFNTDDCIVFTSDENKIEHKLLIQCKLSITISNTDKEFKKTMDAAWFDFSKNNSFNRENDKIALVTGALSKAYDGLLEILRDIHTEVSSDVFWEKYKGIGFSKAAKNKLDIIMESISQANNNVRPSEDEIFAFLKIFYILKSDLHEDVLARGGINLSLLQTELNNQMYSYVKSPQDIWNGLRTCLSDYNRLATPIELSNLPGEIKELFKRVARTNQPQEYVPRQILDTAIKEKLISSSYKKELVLLSILGGIDQKNQSDMQVIEKFNITLSTLQELQDEDNVMFTDGIWKIKTDRKKVVEQLGKKIFDKDIDSFKAIFLQILSEIDTSLDQSENQKQMMGLFNKKFQYSKTLRIGIANGVALVSNNEELFPNCSRMMIRNASALSVRELFADYRNINLWANLNDVLVPIAEICPREFLSNVKKAFEHKNNPFIELANNYKADVLFSTDYLSSFRSALSDLAWDKDYLGESALLLAKLAELEKHNDTYNHHYALTALIETFLPWRPQTTAEIPNKIAVIKNILNNSPVIGWKLLKALLPNKTMSLTSRPLPLWRNVVPMNWLDMKITNEEYWEQEEQYAKLFVINAKELSQILDVIQNIGNLPKPAFDLFVKNLVSLSGKDKLSGNARESIWNALLDEAHRNEQQVKTDMQYSLSEGAVNEINNLIEKFAPNDVLKKYKRLFDTNDFELYEDIKNWKESEKKLEAQRIDAIKNIIRIFDVKAIIDLSEEVKSPYQVGFASGKIDNIDNEVLPQYIDQIPSHEEFIKGYIVSRFYRTRPVDMDENMKWPKNMMFSDWEDNQIAVFLINLPFRQSVWNILENQSQITQDIYWQKIVNFRDIADQGYLDYPFIKLLAAKRPLAAVECFQCVLHHYASKKVLAEKTKDINVELVRQILLDLIESKELNDKEKFDSQMLQYNIKNTIGFLQQKLPLTDVGLWTIEWNFMPLLNSHSDKLPKAVIYSIENNPEVFHQMIVTVFKSKNSLETDKMPVVSKQVINNIYSLTIINNYKILPGKNENGKFVAQKFNSWIKKVKELCEHSGHWDVAQSIIGEYLINAPKDRTGLFIHKSVARVLELYDNQKIRTGYNIGILNNLGVQTMDSTGETNHNRFITWNNRLNEVEKAGFINFAGTLRELAEDFEMDAQRDIIESRKFDNGIFE